MADKALRVPIFPLPGALLLPRARLPLHIFEPRYRAMVRDAMAGDRMIVMVQPRDASEPSQLFDIGCLGSIVASEELGDGRYNIVLEGVSRVRILREAKTPTLYRQVDADSSGFDDSKECEPLSHIQRADLEREGRAYAQAIGYDVDWDAVGRLDDERLVNSVAQVMPLDVAGKQALLEAPDLASRAELLVQFMQFLRLSPGGGTSPGTLQ